MRYSHRVVAEVYVPELRDQIPKRGSRLSRWFGRSLMRLFGWRIEGTLPNRSKMVAIGAPHTTAWDFGMALMMIWALGLRISWMGADWVVRFPFMSYLGGIPVDRSQPHGLVAQSIEQFRSRANLWLAIAPEGSRKKVVPWKSGFYRIAVGAGVPIFLVGMDLKNRVLRLGPEVGLSGDYEADMEERIQPFFARYVDDCPDRFGM